MRPQREIPENRDNMWHATAKIEEHMKLTDTSFSSEKLPSDEQLRRTVERVLGRADGSGTDHYLPRKHR